MRGAGDSAVEAARMDTCNRFGKKNSVKKFGKSWERMSGHGNKKSFYFSSSFFNI